MPQAGTLAFNTTKAGAFAERGAGAFAERGILQLTRLFSCDVGVGVGARRALPLRRAKRSFVGRGNVRGFIISRQSLFLAKSCQPC
jgi:hypothetical protein